MSRRMHTAGICGRCGHRGPVWKNNLKPLDLGTGTILEADTRTPDLCDDCDMLQRLADPWYRGLCGTMADQWEREAIANGGVKPDVC